MGVYKVKIIIKGIEFQSNLFVVQRNGPALLVVPECERLHMMGINCDTTSADLQGRQINKQTSLM